MRAGVRVCGAGEGEGSVSAEAPQALSTIAVRTILVVRTIHSRFQEMPPRSNSTVASAE
jgi:hypothetical protein